MVGGESVTWEWRDVASVRSVELQLDIQVGGIRWAFVADYIFFCFYFYLGGSPYIVMAVGCRFKPRLRRAA
jgi:hypothetical protein